MHTVVRPIIFKVHAHSTEHLQLLNTKSIAIRVTCKRSDLSTCNRVFERVCVSVSVECFVSSNLFYLHLLSYGSFEAEHTLETNVVLTRERTKQQTQALYRVYSDVLWMNMDYSESPRIMKHLRYSTLPFDEGRQKKQLELGRKHSCIRSIQTQNRVNF